MLHNTSLLTELVIFITKILSQNKPHLSLIGVIATLSLVERLSISEMDKCTEDSNQAIELLELVDKKAGGDVYCVNMFYDGLAGLVEKGLCSPSIDDWITESVRSKLQGFVVDDEAGSSR